LIIPIIQLSTNLDIKIYNCVIKNGHPARFEINFAIASYFCTAAQVIPIESALPFGKSNWLPNGLN
jgi:hypothetical protein